MKAKISFYNNIKEVKSKQTIDITDFLYHVKHGKWQSISEKVAIIQDHNKRREKKAEIAPYVTISGYFENERAADKLSLHSNFIGMDIDDIPEELENIKHLLKNDPYVYAIFNSISGNGICVLFRIDGSRHIDAFYSIGDYLLKNYQLIIDQSGKDVSRARYVSYDPDLHINDKAPIFKKYLPKPKKQVQKTKLKTIFVETEFDDIIKQMVDKSVNCVESYHEWLEIAFALSDQFGENGREYFHQLSSISGKYDRDICNKQFTNCLKHTSKGNKITIKTIYYHAKKAGININSQKVKKIAAITSSQKKAGLSAAQIAENLEKHEGISKHEADDIINQAFQADTNFQSEDNIVDQVRAYLRHTYNLKRNLITRKIENNGKIMDEIELNTMFLDCKNIFGQLTSEIFMKIVFSNNTPSYNPLLDWFDNNTGNPEGVIDEFFSCFDTEDDIKYYGKKWLVGVISAIHGIHSPLMLILAGEVQGTGKTEAFRRMLPKELLPYYAESKLDAGKDDEILMCQKLIIMDDEMGGKSKKEKTRLKELTSKQTFTLREPYGRMNVDLDRLAVLCGTTNDLKILNDPTGNRRLIPIQINLIDHKRYNAVDKKLLFIEAYNLWQSGFEWKLTSEDVKRMDVQNEKFEDHPLEYELIIKYFELPNQYNYIELTATEIKIHIENQSNQKIQSVNMLGRQLKKIGFECTIKKINNSVHQVYKVAEKSKTSYSEPPF
jgi:predicted P-loop ATPase